MKRLNTIQITHPRRGVTLTEVLMSMLIMSIGVSFVAAVFPLSVLRTIQASQLTSATIHRFQAEALIDMFPDMIHNPEGIPVDGLDRIPGNADDRPNTYREHFGKNYIVDPWGYHVHLQDGTVFDYVDLYSGNTTTNTPVADWFGIDGGSIGWLQRFDGGILAQTNTVPGGITAAAWGAYRERLAATLAASTDRWETVVDSSEVTPVLDGGGNVIGLTFGPDDDLTAIENPTARPGAEQGVVPDSEGARITIFDDHGHESQSYPVTSVSGTTVYWTESNGIGDQNANGFIDDRFLPLKFFEAGEWDIGHATIELALMRSFSWLMSVRKRGDGNAGVDVAVLFNRGVDAEHEYAYRATFIPRTNLVGIEFDASTEPEPFLKKGGYVFDAENCRWYRIQDFRKRPILGWEYGPYEYVIFTEGTIIEPSGEDIYIPPPPFKPLNQTIDDEAGTDANGNGVLENEDRDGDMILDFGRAVLMPGVIEVYPLGTMTVPEDF